MHRPFPHITLEKVGRQNFQDLLKYQSNQHHVAYYAQNGDSQIEWRNGIEGHSTA